MRLPLIVAALCALALWAMPAPAQDAPAVGCVPKVYVAGWLRDQGYRLDDWGLMGGVQHDLWIGPRGWAVVETAPQGCARVVSLPDAPRERVAGDPA